MANDGDLYLSGAVLSMGQYRLFHSRRAGDGYTSPEQLEGPINEYDAGDAFVDPEQSFILFMSQGRPDNRGRTDIYVSYRESGGGWGEPINLGPTVNSETFERFPSMSRVRRFLYFVRAVEGSYVSADADFYRVDAAVLPHVTN